MQQTTIHTIGHGARSQAELLAILQGAGIRTVVDIRADPQSSHHRHFSQAALREALEAADIVYHWAGRQLGGQHRPLANSVHTALADEGMRGFADFMASADFARAAVQLVSLAARAPLVLLCAERLPEQGQRTLIADYLTLRGAEVVHLIAVGERREHRLSPQARRESAELIYDRRMD